MRLSSGFTPFRLNATDAPVSDYRLLRRLPYLAPTTSPSGANNSSPFTRPDAKETLPNGALHPPPDGVGVGVGSTVAWANMTGVAVGGTGVAVGGTGVAVGGTGVLVDGGGGGLLGKDVEVGNGGTGVAVGSDPQAATRPKRSTARTLHKTRRVPAVSIVAIDHLRSMLVSFG